MYYYPNGDVIMNKNNFLKSVIIFLFLFSSAHAQDTITIGTIDSEPEEKFSKFGYIANYLQKKLNKKNIKVNVEIPKDINTAIKLINENRLDIFVDSVYPTLIVQKKTGVSIECKRWKKGSEGYKSVIFVNKQSSINSIEDLKGKTIAFEDEFSTSAFYIPKKAMEKHGLVVSNKGEPNSLKYSFAGSEKNTAAWVLYKKVDAAATDDLTFESFDKNLFNVIYKSKLVPRHLVSFSKNINYELKKEILVILYNMHNDQEGQKALKAFSKTKKFSHLTSDDLDFLEEFN